MEFDKINLSIANDPRTSEELESNLIEYLRYLTMLIKRVRFEHNDGGSVRTTFMWNDSLN